MLPSQLRRTLEPYILKYLEENKSNHSKQQMTAKNIWIRLKEEGFGAAESTVRQYVRELRNKHPEAFIPLDFDPGARMEIDWGDAYAYIDGQKTKVSIFCAVLPFSYAIFVAVFPTKAYECFFMGHEMAFDFFKGVAEQCIYDNLKTAVFSGGGKDAVKQQEFERFEAHYAFTAVFCNVAAGWEKGGVENLVSIARRIALTPQPRVKSFSELQELATRRCLEYCETHRIRGRKLSVKEALAIERTKLLPLPISHFDGARVVQAKVNPECVFQFETNRYSVPCRLAGETITVRATPFEVIAYWQGSAVATHERSYEKHDECYDPEHYLELLERKPRAILDAAPLKKGTWPKEIQTFRELYPGKDLNEVLVNILRLSQQFSKKDLLWAVHMANQTKRPSLATIHRYLGLVGGAKKDIESWFSVDQVDLSPYDKLLEGSEEKDDDES